MSEHNFNNLFYVLSCLRMEVFLPFLSFLCTFYILNLDMQIHDLNTDFFTRNIVTILSAGPNKDDIFFWNWY